MARIVVTYGTFDLFHIGHLKVLRRLAALGDELHVGVSTDEFNAVKGKQTVISFDDRIEIVRSIGCVSGAFAESSWDQKRGDIQRLNADVFGMGADWEGKFDELGDLCDVVYLKRTPDVSSTGLKRALGSLDRKHLADLRNATELLETIIRAFD